MEHLTILSPNTLEHIIIVFSISYLLTQSRLTEILRSTGIEIVDYFFRCIMCTAFWISLTVGKGKEDVFYLSCVTSVTSYVIYLIVEIIERKSLDE